MEKNTMSLEELKSSYEETSKEVLKLWKSGVINKFKLADVIASSYGMVAFCVDAIEGLKIFNDFLDGLPFGKSVAEKFNRISKTSWLKEVNPSSLPNDYNTLYALCAEKIVRNSFVVDYFKENISSNISRSGVDTLFESATKEEERSKRGKYDPDPETDLTKNHGSEEGETSEDGSTEKDTGSTNDKVEGTLVFSIKVDKDEVGKNREVLMDFVNNINSIADFTKKTSPVFRIETKDKVVVSMLKKITNAETKSRNEGLDSISIRDLVA